MKRFLKGICLAALAIFIIGIGLAVSGAVMGGGVMSVAYNNGSFRLVENGWDFLNNAWYDSFTRKRVVVTNVYDGTENSQSNSVPVIKPVSPTSSSANAGATTSSNYDANAGATASSNYDANASATTSSEYDAGAGATTTVNSGETIISNEKITALELDLGSVEAFLTVGEEFKFQSEGTLKYEMYTRGGKWVIKVKPTTKIFNITNKEKAYITVPKDIVFTQVKIKLGAGHMTIKNIHANDMELDVGAGSMTIDNVSANELDFDVGAGSLTATNVVSNREADLSVGAAKMDVSGKFLGKTSLDCGAGVIKLTLDEMPTDYGYEIDLGMGQVKLFDKSFNGIADVNINPQARPFFEIDVAAGQVIVGVK